MDNNEVVAHVDETLARYSDLLFGTAITVYVLAMFLFLWRWAAPGSGASNQPRHANSSGHRPRVLPPTCAHPANSRPCRRGRSARNSPRWPTRWSSSASWRTSRPS